ncbi:MAG: hypothetical protein IPQ07_04410 [Myxococcales bacterium]|jgi:hypothetical protein|nr:hypothetical protein [Myxococcales bacterium]
MRDDQVRRYARHILLPDVGGIGQTALLTATAHVEVGGDRAPAPSDPVAELIAATYLAAGGVGCLAVGGADREQLAELAAHGPDTRIVSSSDGRPVVLSPCPPWWPTAPGDERALAFWRGGIAATRWMADLTRR